MTALVIGGDAGDAADQPKLARSTDGVTWEVILNPIPWDGVENGLDEGHCIAYDGVGRWVMGGTYNFIAYSDDDGTTWTRGSGGMTSPVGIAYSPEIQKWVAIAGNTIWLSADGAAWTQVNHGLGINGFQSIAYANGLFVVGRIQLDNLNVATSPDGETWTARDTGMVTPPGSNRGKPTVEDVTWDGTRWWAISWGQYSTSLDGITWMRVYPGPLGDGYLNADPSGYMGGIAADGEGNLVIGGFDGRWAESHDGGATWTAYPPDDLFFGKTLAVEFLGTKFVMLGEGDTEEASGYEDNPTFFLTTEHAPTVTWDAGHTIGAWDSFGLLLPIPVRGAAGSVDPTWVARSIDGAPGAPRVRFE